MYESHTHEGKEMQNRFYPSSDSKRQTPHRVRTHIRASCHGPPEGLHRALSGTMQIFSAFQIAGATGRRTSKRTLNRADRFQAELLLVNPKTPHPIGQLRLRCRPSSVVFHLSRCKRAFSGSRRHGLGVTRNCARRLPSRCGACAMRIVGVFAKPPATRSTEHSQLPILWARHASTRCSEKIEGKAKPCFD